MKITTEALLAHRDAFGLTSATPVQRAICRVRDGVPLGDLAEHPDVLEAFGGAVPPSGAPPREMYVIASIRSAKSMIAAAGIIRASQTVDVSRCSPGDIIRHPIVSIRLDNAQAIMSHLVAALERKLLRPLVVGEPTVKGGASIRHPSGRVVEVTPIPLDRAGGAATSFWFSGIDLDEAPRMLGADDGVRNFDHMRDASTGRMLDGAQLFAIGSPHAPFGPIYDLVQERFGKPTSDLVICRARGPVMNPTWWTPQRCADLERQNPTAYRTDVLGDFADPETALISGAALDAVTRRNPAELPPDVSCTYVGSIDPATRRNAFTLVLATRQHGVVRVVLARQWVPRGGRLSPDAVLAEIAQICAPYRVQTLITDQFSIDSMRDLARRHGLRLTETTITAQRKLELFDELHAAIEEETVELCPDAVVRADLLSVRKRVTQAGVNIHLPTTGDGRHADYAPAIALVVNAAARRCGSSFGRGVRVGEGCNFRFGNQRGY